MSTRIVKFQAWHFERKKMYECIWVGQFECQIIIPNEDKFFSDREIMDWKDTPRGKAEVAIRQYTGFETDKDNIEIYEKDIVRFSSTEGEVYTKEVLWDEHLGCWCFGNFSVEKIKNSAYFQDTGLEVIGNSFKNKELLGG